MEAVCNHEKAVGRTLADKINTLLTSNRIPKTLAEMAGQLRQIRRLGAHDTEDEVTEEDYQLDWIFLRPFLNTCTLLLQESLPSKQGSRKLLLEFANEVHQFQYSQTKN